MLLTHAGLTVGLWEDLGEPRSAAQAAAALNAVQQRDPSRVFAAGWLRTGQVDRGASPTWARCGSELAAPWLQRGAMPFNQIHGHESVYWWPGRQFQPDAPAEVVHATTTDPANRFSWVTAGDANLVSVDWVLLDAPPSRPWRPLLLDGAVTHPVPPARRSSEL